MFTSSASSRSSARPSSARKNQGVSPRVKSLLLPSSPPGVQTTEQMQQRILALEREVSNKQVLIDRLLIEVDQRSEAIRNCGAEIVALRKKLSESEFNNAELVKGIKRKKEEDVKEVEKMMDTSRLEGYFTDGGNVEDKRAAVELLNRLKVMGEKYLKEKRRSELAVEKLDAVNKKIGRLKEEESKVRKLETAVEAQARFIQKLQVLGRRSMCDFQIGEIFS
jgi:hypothetical protein